MIDLGGRPARDFAAERARPDVNLFDAVAQHLRAEQAAGRRVLIAGASEGSLERLRLVLADHGVEGLHRIERWDESRPRPGRRLPCCRWRRASSPTRTRVLAEADIVGDRLAAPGRAARGAATSSSPRSQRSARAISWSTTTTASAATTAWSRSSSAARRTTACA